jgi:DMSO/TMAO reductase YedYZ molybdopterin-dependent catalytic subunit
VRVRDVLARAGVDRLGGRTVDVVSLERGLYGVSQLNHLQASDRDTLLALHVNGERLNLDHGYPLRLISPNRPGVLQTKWVTRLVVR